jgi:hypothetical protein
MARAPLFQLPSVVQVLKPCLFCAILLFVHTYVVTPCVGSLVASATSGGGSDDQALRGGPRRLQSPDQPIDPSTRGGPRRGQPFVLPPWLSLGPSIVEAGLFILFIIVFYVQVTSKYPALTGQAPPGSVAAGIMAESSICRIKPGAICLQTCCCPAAMVAHVFDRTGVLNYWASILWSCLCCLSPFQHCYAFMVSDMPEKLGGEKRQILDGIGTCLCCAMCEYCKYAEALDAATGTQTGCLSFSHSGPMQTMATGMVAAPQQYMIPIVTAQPPVTVPVAAVLAPDVEQAMAGS